MKIRRFDGLQDYHTLWQAMKEFTRQRQNDTADEIWLLQHEPVFTVGQAGKLEHLLNNAYLEHHQITLVKSDRGGQITYHGPGQLIAYLLLDIKRLALGVRDLVSLMETALIDVLQEYGIKGYAKKSAPGVYVQRLADGQHLEHKIAALGLRVRKGCCYHGLALNVDMDLSPFHQINPCGYRGLAVSQLSELLIEKPHWHDVENKILYHLKIKLDSHHENK